MYGSCSKIHSTFTSKYTYNIYVCVVVIFCGLVLCIFWQGPISSFDNVDVAYMLGRISRAWGQGLVWWKNLENVRCHQHFPWATIWWNWMLIVLTCVCGCGQYWQTHKCLTCIYTPCDFIFYSIAITSHAENYINNISE